MSQSFKLALLATAAGLVLSACDGSSTSPGTTGPINVVVNPPSTPPTTPTQPPANLVDLVPNDNCPTGTTAGQVDLDPNGNQTPVEACIISTPITADVTLTAENGYALAEPTFVGVDGAENATLTIEAGTTLFGTGTDGYLVVTRGSQINADGNELEPIIFTSLKDVQGVADPLNDRGEWGGLIINGFAPVNQCSDGSATPGTTGCELSGEGSSGLYGGGDAADDSGTLSYVQVRYAGQRISSTDELNGIAFQGVGSQTSCDHIQVHNNQDDGVEFFGGTAFCDYVVLTGNADDSLDWTQGWTGGAQRVLILHTGGAGDQGIEADNNGDNNSAMPFADPTIANFTFIGESGDIGILVREGTKGRIVNGIVTDFPDAGIDVDQSVTIDNLNNGELSFASVLLDNPTNIQGQEGSEASDPAATIRAFPNIVETTNTLNARFFPGTAERGVPAADLTGDPRFDTLAYIGAFGPDETEQDNWARGWTFNLFAAPTTCPDGSAPEDSVASDDPRQVCVLTGRITENLRLNATFDYRLEGPVFIGVDSGSDPASPLPGSVETTLEIDPGVRIFGASTNDYLVISRGSKILSNGTPSNPVIMTSVEELDGSADLANDRGEWGGLVINGRAPINNCVDGTATPGTTGCERSGEGSSGLYGGGTIDDSSGRLTYTRIAFAGARVSSTDELNGIAFQGVGNGTEVDYVQVHNNVDDGVEFFGGTVNASHLVLTGIGDDSIDWTLGWTGRLQFAIVEQADGAGDQGIEADNFGDDNDALPRANPALSNLTMIGGSTGDIGALLREGTAGQIYNTVITDFGDAGFDIDQQATIDQVNAGNLALFSTLISGNAEELANDGDGTTPQQTALDNGANNQVGGAVTDFRGRAIGGDRYAPGAAENALTPTNVTTVDPFFVDAPYVGAVRDADDDWYQGWTLLVDQRTP